MLPNKLLPDSLGGAFQELKTALDNGKKCIVTGAAKNARRHISCATGRFVLFVAPDRMQAVEAQEILADYYGGRVVFIPEQRDALVNSKLNFSESAAQRAGALADILTGEAVAATVSAESLLDWFPDINLFKKAIKRLKTGEEIPPEILEDVLTDGGYKRTAAPERVGEFSRRGDVLDVWTSALDMPARIEFFGDEIESIRLFAPDTMLSVREINELIISPRSDILVSKNGVIRAQNELLNERRNAYRELGEIIGAQLEKLTADPTDPALVWSLPFLDERGTVFDYIPEGGVLVFDDPRAVYDKIVLTREQHLTRVRALRESGSVSSRHSNAISSPEKVVSAVSSFNRVLGFQQLLQANPLFNAQKILTISSPQLTRYHLNLEALKTDVSQAMIVGRQVIVFAGDEGTAKTLSGFFEERGLSAHITEDLSDTYPLLLVPKRLKHGFSYPDYGLVVIGTEDVLKKGSVRQKASVKRRQFVMPAKGDYVVHERHGIGIFDGMQTLTTSLGTRDYFCILYKGGDKLYLPTDRLDEVERYTGAQKPHIHSMKSHEFEKVKERVRNSVKQMAIDLKSLYEKRLHAKGHVYEPDTVWQKELEDAFPFTPTDDQLVATAEIKSDMESGKVMDRLLVGDVGFGKTEVAVRAIFKTVVEGKQAAVLAPTTILANQHFQTIASRLEPFGIKIDLLSRLVSSKDISGALKRIKSGETSVVVATHRLLGKDVVFHDLGLLVLDEEQRFGVEHKEKIKALKTNVNVLSMSATPIPRTLHMSLSGIRDISVLETPPEGRLPVETYVVELTDSLLKDACMREVGRGGQVYILFNRVQGIEKFTEHVGELLGDGVRIIYAHGQMPPNMLNERIQAFYDKKADILIATAIIENGIDIPDANTLIVVDADRFGLGELYQLRGRVGRSPKLAYAYFTVREGAVITEEAAKRLEALTSYTELGSGFRIAMRDLEIRGAGNVLGKEQHGNMERVGYDMYCRILKESIEELTGTAKNTEGYFEVTMEVEGDAELDREYISDPDARVAFYKRAASLENLKEMRSFLSDTEDVYGKAPESAKLLAKIGLAKNLAKRLGVKKVVSTKNGAGLEFKDSAVYKNTAVLDALERFSTVAVLTPRAFPVILFKAKGLSAEERFDNVFDFLIAATSKNG